MPRKQVNVRLPELTIQQLRELAQLFGMSEGQVITMAIDRIYRETKRG